jgi:hypothetical protein
VSAALRNTQVNRLERLGKITRPGGGLFDLRSEECLDIATTRLIGKPLPTKGRKDAMSKTEPCGSRALSSSRRRLIAMRLRPKRAMA